MQRIGGRDIRVNTCRDLFLRHAAALAGVRIHCLFCTSSECIYMNDIVIVLVSASPSHASLSSNRPATDQHGECALK